MPGFVHLHLHSEYSLLDGACRIADIPAAAAAAGHDAVAITDHGVMYGAVAFFRACREAGIKPIIGCEVYVAPNSRHDKSGTDRECSHLILLVRNEEGYKNLIKLVSLAFTEGFFGRPRVDMELLEKYSGGLTALSACLSGAIPRALLAGDMAAAEKIAMSYRAVFGENFYLEVQDHGLEEQRMVNTDLKKLGDKLGIPFVATNDVHYIKKSDAETQAALMCIQTGSVLGDGRISVFEKDEFYYKSTEEMTGLFRDFPGAIENTVKIAAECNFEFDFKRRALPRYNPENGMKPDKYLRTLALDGLKKFTENKKIIFGSGEDTSPEAYKMRVEYELLVIHNMGYDEYFLIVADFVRWAKEHEIPTGPGRGSGAGSLVGYLIGITEVDPIHYGLLFERFLNPERVTMPDFDIDFGDTRRDEVINYVAEKYGRDHVSQIVTFDTLAARAAVRDVGRATGMSYASVDAVARLVPQTPGITLDGALASSEELRRMYEADADVRRLVDISKAVEGMPRHASTHAAGVVITDEPVSDYVPLSGYGDDIVIQYDKDTVEAFGLMKIDFLGLRYLTVIAGAEEQIKHDDPAFSLRTIPLDDAETFALISSGRTGGVFQLESAGMRQMLTSFRPSSMEDIMIAIALYRPGPMEFIPKLLRNRADPSLIKYDIPELSEILATTYGCIIYQEQVMQIFRRVASFSYGRADIVRRAMSKKKAEIIEAERGRFMTGAARNGTDEAAAKQLFEDMAGFASYAFNKSHAAGYAMVSYQTAYLKAHYPRQYMASLLTSVLHMASKTAEYMSECEHSDPPVRILPPDINESNADFSVSGGDIRFGLASVKGVGASFVTQVEKEREKRKFTSFIDYAQRMSGADSGKRQTAALIMAGAFDNLGVDRARLIADYEIIMEKFRASDARRIEGQMGLFDDDNADTINITYHDLPPLPLADRLRMEKESTGMYFSGHPLDGYSRHIALCGAVPLSEATLPEAESGFRDRQTVTVAGVVIRRTAKLTKKNQSMAFVTIEDRYSEMEIVVFPEALEKFGALLNAPAAVALSGQLSFREDEEGKLLLSDAVALIENDEYDTVNMSGGLRVPSGVTQARQTPARPQVQTAPPVAVPEKAHKLFLRVPDMKGGLFTRALAVTEIFEGDTGVVFYDCSASAYRSMSGRGIAPTQFVLRELGELLGPENVILK